MSAARQQDQLQDLLLAIQCGTLPDLEKLKDIRRSDVGKNFIAAYNNMANKFDEWQKQLIPFDWTREDVINSLDEDIIKLRYMDCFYHQTLCNHVQLCIMCRSERFGLMLSSFTPRSPPRRQ